MKISIGFVTCVLLMGVIFSGCTFPTQTIKEEKVFEVKLGIFDKQFLKVVIDSCEYLYTDEGTFGQTVFHKGNCKFCEERNKKLVNKIILSLYSKH